MAADATDAERLTALTRGAAALYNCANPAYHQWLTDWPPMAARCSPRPSAPAPSW